jgi:hypothetical protein
MTKIPKAQPVSSKPTGAGTRVRKGSSSGSAKAQSAKGTAAAERIVVFLDGIDLADIKAADRDPSDPISAGLQKGVRQIAENVYGYGGKDERFMGQMAQAMLRAAEKAQTDPNLLKMMKSGTRQALDPTGTSNLSKEKIDTLAERILKAWADVTSSS